MTVALRDLSAPAVIPPLPAQLTSRGGSPDLVADELLWIITDAIENHPRTLQKKIGPSEIGGPCARQIGYKLLGLDIVNTTPPPNWKATVGTAVHALLETYFDRFNLMFADSTGGQERFLVEHRVNVGTIGGIDIWGNDDLYDRVTATVIDWKTCTPEKIRHYKANGPGQKYRAQAHLYGRGFIAQGMPVDNVMLVFLLRNGELRDHYIWHEPYDEQVALDALARANAIHAATALGGRAALALLPTADHYCSNCPFFKARSTDPAQGCPGDPSSSANQPTKSALTISR